jgi:glycine betaine/proline transport system ATP-binding protein
MRAERANDEPAIVLDRVWKIFGAREEQAMAAIRKEGIGKAEVAERFGCVVGVADVTLSIARGEIFCVMGLSGSGKSTLIRHINRLLEPTDGTILVDGEDILRKSPAELRMLRARRIGMVFQSFGLLPHRTVRDNVALPLEIQGATRQARFDVAEDALAKVNLGGWGDRYCYELSGGMQQRVGLARALAADPAILLMDEPFSALDPLIRRQLQDEFLALSKAMGKTVVFITHDLDEAIRIGNRIAIMKDGVVIQSGAPEDIVANPQHDYVRAFVAHIPRLDVISAARVMEPLEAYEARNAIRVETEGLPRARAEAKLVDLIEIAAHSAQPIAIVADDGRPLGVVDRQMLLESLKRNPYQ